MIPDDLAAPASVRLDRRRRIFLFLADNEAHASCMRVTRRMRGFKTRNTSKTYLVFLGSCAMTMKPLTIMWKYIIKLTLPTQFIYYMNDIYSFTWIILVLTDTYN